MSGKSGSHPWTITADGVTVAVRLTPRGGRDRLGGVREGPDGRVELLARVAAPPVEGAANAALVRLVAKTLGVSRSAVRFVGGESSRSKRLAIKGDPRALEAALLGLLEGPSERRARRN